MSSNKQQDNLSWTTICVSPSKAGCAQIHKVEFEGISLSECTLELTSALARRGSAQYTQRNPLQQTEVVFVCFAPFRATTHRMTPHTQRNNFRDMSQVVWNRKKKYWHQHNGLAECRWASGTTETLSKKTGDWKKRFVNYFICLKRHQQLGF